MAHIVEIHKTACPKTTAAQNLLGLQLACLQARTAIEELTKSPMDFLASHMFKGKQGGDHSPSTILEECAKSLAASSGEAVAMSVYLAEMARTMEENRMAREAEVY